MSPSIIRILELTLVTTKTNTQELPSWVFCLALSLYRWSPYSSLNYRLKSLFILLPKIPSSCPVALGIKWNLKRAFKDLHIWPQPGLLSLSFVVCRKKDSVCCKPLLNGSFCVFYFLWCFVLPMSQWDSAKSTLEPSDIDNWTTLIVFPAYFVNINTVFCFYSVWPFLLLIARNLRSSPYYFPPWY